MRYIYKACYKTAKYRLKTCYYKQSPYLCSVFFIVLDLRLTKDWLSGKIAFFILSLLAPPKKSVTAKNEKGKNQSKIACKNIGNAKVCFSRIRKHVCTRIFPYSYTYVQTCADVCMYNYMSKIKFHIKDKGVF